MKKIGFFLPGNLENSGGAERVLNIVANYLCKKYKIVIFAFSVENSFYKYDERIKLISLDKNSKSNIGLFSRLKLIFFNLSKLRKIFIQEKLSCIINLNYRADLISKLLLGKTMKNYFLWEHNSFFEKKSKIEKFYRYFLLKYNKKLILVNKAEIDDYKKVFDKSKIIYIPNPLSIYSSEKTELNNNRIISVGRLDKVKNHLELLEIFKLVHMIKPEIRLTIIGKDCGQKTDIFNKIKQLNLESAVEVKEETRNITFEYLKSDLLILTSKYESFSLVLIEAKECGLPSISYNCPSGPKEIIKDGEDGFLISFGDKKSMVEKIMMLYRDKNLFKNFSKQAIINSKEYKIEKLGHIWHSFLKEEL